MSTTPTKPIRAALIDLSGTIHIGQNAIPGAYQAIQKLLKHNIKVLFLTNTSKISSSSLLQQLRDIGFDDSVIQNDAIMTSVGACRQYLTTICAHSASWKMNCCRLISVMSTCMIPTVCWLGWHRASSIMKG